MEDFLDTSDERILLLRRILGSRSFARSVKLQNFLELICMWEIEGRGQEISELQIGVRVFGRLTTYSPSDDSIVRTQARLLRQRLAEYFDQEAPDSPIVITIPRGRYVPLFERKEILAPDIPGPSHHVPEPKVSIAATRTQSGKVVVAACLALVAALATAAWLQHRRLHPDDYAGALWSQIFEAHKPVLIVPSDDALVLFQEAMHKPVSPDTYFNHSWLNSARMPPLSGSEMGPRWLSSHQYTSMADLNLALRLGRLRQARDADVQTHNARDLRLEDLKQNNVILIGGTGSNPWVQLFADRLNFTVQWDWQRSEGFVVNKHPAAGEPGIYQDDFSGKAPVNYGVLAYLPGLDANGDALLFEGTGMAGTESASDFPFSPDLFRDFAQRIGATHGHIPYFEVLLKTTDLGGNAPEAKVISYRLIKD